ncbi:MAG: type II toxin-antitoxin system RelE/ParE family toxin [Nanoarchaeota archaeon]|nr:type II toxin-antitoxin system RelE/ParE family toxin [Nanoarchaeota archaeon]
MKRDIEWAKKGLEDLDRLEQINAKRILRKINTLKEFISSDIKRLAGSNSFRLRVGNYRIIFEIDGRIINILRIGHRKNIY